MGGVGGGAVPAAAVPPTPAPHTAAPGCVHRQPLFAAALRLHCGLRQISEVAQVACGWVGVARAAGSSDRGANCEGVVAHV